MAEAIEHAGFTGALIGSGWGRTDTFTLATALTARTQTFTPLAAIRPGYWQPAQFACAAATLDQLSQGRLFVNIVTGRDDHEAYGDFEQGSAERYARTQEFMQLVRRLWTETDVSYQGEFYRVEHSTCEPRPFRDGGPPLWFGGASPAAEEVAAAEADVQLVWGEDLAMAGERIERLRRLAEGKKRARPLEFGLRITVVVRETSEEAWDAARQKLGAWEGALDRRVESNQTGKGSVGQARLQSLTEGDEVRDRCLWTAPARIGNGAASTWLVGSAEEVKASLLDYAELGFSKFILSDTPYREEAIRVGELVVRPLLAQNGASEEGQCALYRITPEADNWRLRGPDTDEFFGLKDNAIEEGARRCKANAPAQLVIYLPDGRVEKETSFERESEVAAG